MIVAKVTVHRFVGVIGLQRDAGRGMTFEIKRDDLAFVGDRAGEIVNVAARG